MFPTEMGIFISFVVTRYSLLFFSEIENLKSINSNIEINVRDNGNVTYKS